MSIWMRDIISTGIVQKEGRHDPFVILVMESISTLGQSGRRECN
jgi:hypothetical protein